MTTSAQQGYSTPSITSTLPFTGLDAGFIFVAGFALVAVGVFMRRLVRQT